MAWVIAAPFGRPVEPEVNSTYARLSGVAAVPGCGELGAISHDCVIYTHFIAINVVAAAARGSDSVICFRPDHASVTVVETHGGEIRLIALGREAETSVLTR